MTIPTSEQKITARLFNALQVMDPQLKPSQLVVSVHPACEVSTSVKIDVGGSAILSKCPQAIRIALKSTLPCCHVSDAGAIVTLTGSPEKLAHLDLPVFHQHLATATEIAGYGGLAKQITQQIAGRAR
jgi:hypothetical protein